MSLKVYKASAGSGKTFQLALEYIALALESGSPTAFTNILAVTFTNKATSEMKDRILAQLYNLANGGQDKAFMDKLRERLILTASEIEQRAERTLHAIVHDYDRFRVETIDSFFQSLLAGLAHELNLARGFSVDLDNDLIVSRAVDRMLLSIGHSSRVSAHVSNLVLHYMEEQIEEDKGWNIANELKSFAQKNLFGEVYLHNESKLEQVLADKTRLDEMKSTLQRHVKELANPIHEAATELEHLLNAPSKNANPAELKAYKSIQAYAVAMLTDKFEIEPATTMLKAMDDYHALLKKNLQTQESYTQLAARISKLLSTIEPLRKKILPFAATADLMRPKIVPLCLLSEIGREVTKLNNENGTFMLAKTPDFFNKMVAKEDASFVFERSGITFRHVLIDEFQDTSRMQWDNFKRLLIENMAQGDECMLVGDIKQSIYRWRGGDWEILGNIADEMKYLGQVNTHTLDHNFRSRCQIIDFNNRFFDNAIRLLDDINGESKYDNTQLVSRIYEDVTQKAADQSQKGYVRLCMPTKQTTDDEVMEDVYEQIVRLHSRHIPFEKMGILVRQKKQAVQLIRYFAENHPDVPLTSDEAFMLSASPAVTLIVAALKYINNEADTVALQMCRAMVAQLQQNGLPQVQWNETDIEQHRSEWIHTPLYELCRLLMVFFKLPEAEANGCGQSAYLFSFLDKVLEYLENNASELNAFLNYWDESLHRQAIAVDIKDSVYIMTIHKSKGLERHTIFIPFCNWDLDTDRMNDILWCETAGLPAPFDTLPIIPISSYNGTKVKASAFSPTYFKEHLMQRIDSINELYVAFTRAKQNMLIWSKPGRKQKTVHVLIENFVQQENARNLASKTHESFDETSNETFVTEYGALDDYESGVHKFTDNPLDTTSADKVPIWLSGLPTAVNFRQSNRAKDFISEAKTDVTYDAINDNPSAEISLPEASDNSEEQKQNSYIDRGKLLHYLFSLINTKSDTPHALRKLRTEGLITDEREAVSLQRLIDKRLSHPLTADWFDGSWRIFAECNLLITESNGTTTELRPDRVMTRGNETVVVDYKFGKFNEKYVEQVKGYMDALRRMGHKHVKGYLWFVYNGEVREVY